MQFNKSLDYVKQGKFPKMLEQLSGGVKEAFLEYLVWRNAPISKLDYNLLEHFIEQVNKKLGGDQTEVFLCDSLKEAMAAHTNTRIDCFRRRFDGCWWKRVPKDTEEKLAREESRRRLQDSFKQRQAAGQTYRTSSAARLYGQVHRTSGHA
jgi:hypothetical protein